MMNNKWIQILVFSLLFGAVGYLIGRSCGHGWRGRDCGSGAACVKGGACPHGGACTGMGGCDGMHDGKGMMGGHRGMMMWQDGGGTEMMIHHLEKAGFEGDTTFTSEGSTVTVSRHGDRMEVKVEKEEKAPAEDAK
ncbi:MAG: hypothetical protein H6597_08300 [Flavobacteriales bacterium]|nr:hypothetical protein [Flavobacteriales bacterium]MCB9194516.1 hypothetical protein [Flavobacteriales bacterium]